MQYFPQKITVTTESRAVGSERQKSPSVMLSPHNLSELTPAQQLQAISGVFVTYCTAHSTLSIPNDFLKLTISAMEHLKLSGRTNVVYKLCKAVGTKRRDGSDLLLPCLRMPMHGSS